MPITPTQAHEPLPINAQTLSDAVGESPRKLDATEAVRQAIARVEPVNTLELAEKYFQASILDNEGKPRRQKNNECFVLIVEHFKRWLDSQGLGACIFNGQPHLYGGTHWQPVEPQLCESLLGQLAERMGYQVITSKFFIFREKLLKQFYSEFAALHTSHPHGKTLVNFLNGTMEFTNGSGKLRHFDKSDALTYQLPFGFDEHAKCPTFDKYLLRVLPDPNSRDVLAEFLGWLFLKDLKLEKVLVLYGDGHNGKSVFFDVVNALLGEQNVSNIGLSSLSKIENRYQLGQALLNFGSEISDRCDPDLFKKLASGEPVEARRLFKDVFTMRNYARLAFNANVLPRETEQTTGFFRRFLIIPFSETITESEKDPDLAQQIIKTELPGVFNWLMQGLRRLHESRSFSACPASTHALEVYKKESDSVAMFLEDENFISSTENKIGKDDVYKQYRDYCHSAGSHPLSKNNFGKRMLRHYKIKESKSGGCRFWHLQRIISEE
jgi:putative DNA primase/helicase